MTIYDDLLSISKDVIGEFAQGVVTKLTVTITPAANEWELDGVSTVPTVIDAVVSGISSKYVDGERILMTDLMVTIPGDVAVDAGSQMTIDGKAVQIVQVIPVPAAGTAVINKIIARR